jgi:hypothetical protein
MTTAAATAAARPQHQASQDRIFYSGMAILMALTVFAGFAPTFYLRAWFDWPVYSGEKTLPPLAYVHGAVFSAWVVLFIVQTALVATRRLAMHRRLGIAGVVLAAAMIVVGLRAAFAAAARGAAPPGMDPITFLTVPFTQMVMFTAFVSAAIWRRRDRESHKRLMLLAYVTIIGPAVARIPLPPLLFPVSVLFVAMGMAYEFYSRGRIHAAYLWGGALLVISEPARQAMSGTRRVACVRGSDDPLTHPRSGAPRRQLRSASRSLRPWRRSLDRDECSLWRRHRGRQLSQAVAGHRRNSRP